MATYTHLLDTSALLAHYFDEPGAAEVDAIWQDPKSAPAICALTIAELRTRLGVEVASPDERERAIALYLDHLTACVAVDRATAEEAFRLRESTPQRLPLVDACIAACASLQECVLVHRDPHLDRLPASAVRQLRLPDRGSA